MSAVPRLALIIGSTRPQRFADKPADWLIEQADRRDDFTLDRLDLRDFDLPFFAEAGTNLHVDSHDPRAVAWQDAIRPYDGYIFLVSEYNHSIPSVLKNAIDYVYAEWNDKAAGLVAYGTVGGTRAVEQLRGILSAVKIAHVHQQLAFSVFTDFDEAGAFTPDPRDEQAMTTQFDQVEAWARALKTVRS